VGEAGVVLANQPLPVVKSLRSVGRVGLGQYHIWVEQSTFVRSALRGAAVSLCSYALKRYCPHETRKRSTRFRDCLPFFIGSMESGSLPEHGEWQARLQPYSLSFRYGAGQEELAVHHVWTVMLCSLSSLLVSAVVLHSRNLPV
jgi:hypothetical protein